MRSNESSGGSKGAISLAVNLFILVVGLLAMYISATYYLRGGW